ncbi:hypothetical protein ES332_D10G194400v1 [Gossypium tomentosum]|uniref:Uncharacterized protein n=1 Tax=Gossypium tomentosum TaxID=34277 RepID=A0A5D2J5U5_GOSTO|nr:hypothetical protein ES332_D10G194400v1 [Gossypium tomentosum]
MTFQAVGHGLDKRRNLDASRNNFESWLTQPEFLEVVTKSWRVESNIVDNVSNFINLVQDWNKTIFGNIFARKKKALGELKRVQGALEKYNSTQPREKETELQCEIESILNQEELFWA